MRGIWSAAVSAVGSSCGRRLCVCHKPDVLATCLGGEAACFSISLLFVGLPRFAPRRPQCEWHEGAAFEAEAPTTAVSTAPLSALVYWQQQLKV